jgi:acylphosphatase
VFEGDDERVDSMVDWARRGPSGAHVSDVDVTWEDPEGERSFSIR